MMEILGASGYQQGMPNMVLVSIRPENSPQHINLLLDVIS